MSGPPVVLNAEGVPLVKMKRLVKVVKPKKTPMQDKPQVSLLKPTSERPVTTTIPLALHDSPVLAPPKAPTTTQPLNPNKLFVLKNGELKSIKKSNISSSGIIKFMSNSAGSENTMPTTPNLRPIASKFIVNNEIKGGVMTMEQYRHQLDVHRRNLLQQRAMKVAVDPVTIFKMIRPEDLDLDGSGHEDSTTAEVVAKKRPGRKKGVLNKKEENVSSLLEPAPSGSRTRSGRVSRPPRHIQRFYAKDISGEGGAAKESIYLEEDSIEEPPVIKKQKRIIGGERHKCEQCGKSYVNDAKLQHHILVAHEMSGSGGDGQHHALENATMRIDCFNFLLQRLKKVPMKLRGKVFLDEMEIFVKKMHKLVEKLIRSKNCLKDGFLNYSQVHQVPKVLEGVLNVPAGQYHFDTQVIDADEKTILGDTAAEKATEPPAITGDDNTTVVPEEATLISHQNESALSGFDDSSTQPILISGGHDTLKDTSSFSGHMISLEDAIYGQLPGPGGTGVQSESVRGVLSDDEEDDVDDEEEDDDDDLTTPKKEPQPSPSTRRLKKLKRVVKNLSESNSFPLGDGRGDQLILQGVTGEGVGGLVAVMEGQADCEPVLRTPVIKDLSMELFRSPDINSSSSSRRRMDPGGGSGTGFFARKL